MAEGAGPRDINRQGLGRERLVTQVHLDSGSGEYSTLPSWKMGSASPSPSAAVAPNDDG